jgi:hypothetical protein
MAESGIVIGKVASVLGEAFATGTDGIIRPINVGDPVFEGEAIQAPPGGHVELAFGDGTAYFARDNESVTLDGKVFGDSVGQAGNVVGRVALIEGQVFAMGPDGTVRQLKAGDPVYEGDLIQTSAGGRVELAFDNGSVYFLRDKESVTLDGMVLGGLVADAREAALLPGSDGELDNIARAIAQGNNLDQLLEETAAGRSSLFGRTGDGHSFVQLLRIVESIDPLGYRFGALDGGPQDQIIESRMEGDADGDVSTATVSFNVGSVDDLPLAVNDSPLGITEDTPFSGTLAGNDTPSGDGGNLWSLATAATNGTVVVNNDGTFTYTPNANFNGADSFSYSITDADGDVSTATVSFNVGSVDDLPLAVNDSPLGITEDTPFSGTLAGNDTPSGDGGNLWSLATAATNGTVVVNNDGTFTYTPNANFNGADSFSYSITDADGDVSTATVSFNVGSVDDLPLAVNDSPLGITEDTPFSGTLAGNDTPSGDGGNLWSLATAATNGTVVVNNDGTFTYTPNANFNGADSFSYSITDADGDVSTATVSFNVGSVDDLPLAVNDSPLGITEDTPFSGTLAGNDTPSGDGGNLWSLATAATNGTVVVNNDGTFTYTPNANFNGADSFSYSITDADGDVSTATVSFNVGSVDDLPLAVNDSPLGITEDTPFSGTLAGNDTPSGDGGNLWSLATAATNGTVVVNNDGTFTYTPNANFNGADSFSYSITDADGDVSTATVSFNVGSVDDLPLAVNDSPLGITEDTPFSGTLAGNDTPSGDGGNLWSLATAATNGTVVVNNDGTFTYTPNANFNGADSFSYSITDADGDVSTATVSFNVGSVDDLPLAVNDSPLGITEDTPFSGTLAGNDTPSGDGGNLWSLATAATNGTVVVNNDGTFTYTPNANFNGADSFSYSITDADGDVSTATVSFNVGSVDDLPLAVNDSPLGITEDTPFSGTLAGNDTPSGDGGNLWSLATAATNGTVVVNNDGTFTYTPNANFNGADSFSYSITDADGDVSTATVSFNVGSVDDLPLAVNDSPLGITEDTPFSGTLAGNDTPSGDGGNLWSLATAATNGTVVVNNDGTFTYTPNANFNGADSFSYSITDADGDVSTATVSFNVGSVDDLPLAVNDSPLGITEGHALQRHAGRQRHALGRRRQPLEPGHGGHQRHRGGQQRRHLHLHPERQLQRRRQLQLQHHRRRRRRQHGDGELQRRQRRRPAAGGQ